MKSVEQFMQGFFEDRVRFNQKYYDTLLQPEKGESLERLESTEVFGKSATATTRIDLPKHYVRLRYDLRTAGESWIIERTRTQCAKCRGTGEAPRNKQECVTCKGQGWI
jgi:DnaJ-class molecular chaperone